MPPRAERRSHSYAEPSPSSSSFPAATADPGLRSASVALPARDRDTDRELLPPRPPALKRAKTTLTRRRAERKSREAREIARDEEVLRERRERRERMGVMGPRERELAVREGRKQFWRGRNGGAAWGLVGVGLAR